MGIELIVAVASLAIGTASFVEGQKARKESRRAQERAASEQRASNAAQAAQERRQQIREERVRRARILQAGENTGTGGSTLEAGALGSLSTTLGSNLGFSAGARMRADNMSIFGQQAANANSRAQQMDSIFSLSSQLFSSAGGFGTVGNIFKSPDFMGGSTPIGNFVGTPQAGA